MVYVWLGPIMTSPLPCLHWHLYGSISTVGPFMTLSVLWGSFMTVSLLWGPFMTLSALWDPLWLYQCYGGPLWLYRCYGALYDFNSIVGAHHWHGGPFIESAHFFDQGPKSSLVGLVCTSQVHIYYIIFKTFKYFINTISESFGQELNQIFK